MHLLSHLLGLYGALHPVGVLAKTAKKTSSGSEYIFILLILALGAYLLFGPRSRRRRQQMDQQRQFSAGDDVVTTSGLIGRIEEVEADRVHLKVAPGTTIEVLRTAISRRLDPVVPPSDEVSQAGEQDQDHDHPGDESEPGTSS